MNKRQAKKGRNPHGFWRGIRKAWWYQVYPMPRWRKRVLWVKKQWSFRNRKVNEVKGDKETETWNGIHAQITAPKGTFDKIWNDTDDRDDI